MDNNNSIIEALRDSIHKEIQELVNLPESAGEEIYERLNRMSTHASLLISKQLQGLDIEQDVKHLYTQIDILKAENIVITEKQVNTAIRNVLLGVLVSLSNSLI